MWLRYVSTLQLQIGKLEKEYDNLTDDLAKGEDVKYNETSETQFDRILTT